MRDRQTRAVYTGVARRDLGRDKYYPSGNVKHEVRAHPAPIPSHPSPRQSVLCSEHGPADGVRERVCQQMVGNEYRLRSRTLLTRGPAGGERGLDS